MRTYENKIVPAYTRTCVKLCICDLCGAATKKEGDWGSGYYDTEETEVRYKTGSNYPEGGGGEETTIDICHKCFTEKLIPWVEAQGGKPTVKEWNW